MTSAFAAPSALSTRRATATVRCDTTRMCARTPGDESAAPSKYSQYINRSRLNKAPLIQINSFPNEEYNNVSVSLVDLHTDQGAAESLLAGELEREPVGPAPPVSAYSDYYDPATVNKAPFIAISGSAKDILNCSIHVAMYDVPLQVNVPKAILDSQGGGDPAKAFNFMQPPAVAPEIQVYPDAISLAFVDQQLNLAAAQSILDTYRK